MLADCEIYVFLAHFIWHWVQTARWWYFAKFLLEAKLRSESFDTLDDLLRFQVQKLWPKNNKLFN